jgi:hypothetical protein
MCYRKSLSTPKSEASMKKLILLIFVIFLFVFPAANCFGATIKTLETTKDEGYTTPVVYEQDWETVYAAVKYVWRHSENNDISQQYGLSVVDYATEDKAIYVTYPTSGSTEIGIFFKPLRNNRTRVDYVYDGSIQSVFKKGIIDSIVDEVAYFLAHNQQEYREYTHKLKEQWLKEQEEERKKKNKSIFE